MRPPPLGFTTINRPASWSLAGNYALKLHFDDGHDSGLFSWNYLYDLATHQEAYWNNYLQRLKEAGVSREPASIQFKQL